MEESDPETAGAVGEREEEAEADATPLPPNLIVLPEDGKAPFPLAVVVGLEEGEVAEIATVDAPDELKMVNWP